MEVLKIVDSQHHPIAQITWESQRPLSIEMLDAKTDPQIESTLKDFLQNCQSRGLPLRTSRLVEEAERSFFINEQNLVQANDERFLQALSNAISRYIFGEQQIRLFGLIQQ